MPKLPLEELYFRATVAMKLALAHQGGRTRERMREQLRALGFENEDTAQRFLKRKGRARKIKGAL